jgi:hypothetical protein
LSVIKLRNVILIVAIDFYTLWVIMLSVIMLSITLPSAIMLGALLSFVNNFQ